ncbi:MAG TPA: HAMP domain-containing sensor histidine kinase [Pyrinomonadaceae bacterium]|jgi:signal transduction histidine kinase
MELPSFASWRSKPLQAEKTVVDSPTNNERNGVEQVDDERVAHLIEQLKVRTVELEEANRELRHVSHYRSLFLARMSHELRTPLTSILGFAEIMLDQEKLTEAQQRFCQKIQNSGMQLLTSLNQLVDLSRLEVGTGELFLQEFSLPETLRETCAAVARQAQKRDVRIECNPAPEVTTIVSDEGRLRQALYTFFAWAVSRSRAGQCVNVYAELLDGPFLRVQIDDEGEPIKDMLRVFDPAETPRAGKTDLNELGIIVGRRLLEVMKGTVTLENRESTGLRTLIELPAGPPKA